MKAKCEAVLSFPTVEASASRIVVGVLWNPGTSYMEINNIGLMQKFLGFHCFRTLWMGLFWGQCKLLHYSTMDINKGYKWNLPPNNWNLPPFSFWSILSKLFLYNHGVKWKPWISASKWHQDWDKSMRKDGLKECKYQYPQLSYLHFFRPYFRMLLSQSWCHLEAEIQGFHLTPWL